ncbi:Ca2+-binding EF-hand superfamily protein [Sphingopyxis sp. OAS728]|uniref:EF-hand domain-containing protein n=1 Tax=Sphingopyxis sp. OAS728 TaxID=2663823 RepID=UPI00178A12F7|nr:EF-hand domain-containing protein [Sphingopyxis sp. OAS728]MBE1526612.1 Ca2+-binding EF-hand superfamily protein [Sphingopyxis sp. OAS728]
MKKLTMIAASIGLAVPAIAAAQPPQDDGRMFAAIDTNSDGKLDKAEITKMAEMRAQQQGDPAKASPERIDAFIKFLDANGDGVVDKAELAAKQKARAEAPPAEDTPQDAN